MALSSKQVAGILIYAWAIERDARSHSDYLDRQRAREEYEERQQRREQRHREYEARQKRREQNQAKWDTRLKEWDRSRAIKERLIIEASLVQHPDDWSITQAYHENSLLEQWKAAGSSGNDHNDDLWSRFKAAKRNAREKFSTERRQEREYQKWLRCEGGIDIEQKRILLHRFRSHWLNISAEQIDEFINYFNEKCDIWNGVPSDASAKQDAAFVLLKERLRLRHDPSRPRPKIVHIEVRKKAAPRLSSD